MDKEILEKLIEAIGSEMRALTQLYASVIKRLAWEEIKAIWDLIQAGERRAAEAELRRRFTHDELVDEKRLIVEATEAMANSKADAAKMTEHLAWVILRAILGSLIGAGVGAVVL